MVKITILLYFLWKILIKFLMPNICFYVKWFKISLLRQWQGQSLPHQLFQLLTGMPIQPNSFSLNLPVIGVLVFPTSKLMYLFSFFLSLNPYDTFKKDVTDDSFVVDILIVCVLGWILTWHKMSCMKTIRLKTKKIFTFTSIVWQKLHAT